MTLENAKKIFTADFLSQLSLIRINGNYGDVIMNPETPDIVEYFKQVNPKIKINISTNGSAQNATFWKRLAKSRVVVIFALDGLADTHNLYRQNTSWENIIKNATAFIQAGGKAVWKMIQFDHNQHQIEDCRTLATQLGFFDFSLVDHGRDTGLVFNEEGQLTHVLGNPEIKNFKFLFTRVTTDHVMIEDVGHTPKSCVTCETQSLKSIYIAANGDVSPCCWTGFYPKTYGKGGFFQAVNGQLAPLIYKHNALEYPIEECIKWFSAVSDSWNKKTFEDGRLLVCDWNCGS
jgi:MoaA/NifB/PqqE/SkfB family radical SAM enzyme